MKKAKKKKMSKAIKLQEIPQHNADMRANAKPEVQKMMDEVQQAIDKENDLMDQRLDGEHKLRQWAATLCGVTLDMTEIEELNDNLKHTNTGQVYTFRPKRSGVPITLYKTVFGTVDRLDRYIFALEKTVVDLTKKTLAEPVVQLITKDPYTDATFFDLIKLAFKRLFTRRK